MKQKVILAGKWIDNKSPVLKLKREFCIGFFAYVEKWWKIYFGCKVGQQDENNCRTIVLQIPEEKKMHWRPYIGVLAAFKCHCGLMLI